MFTTKCLSLSQMPTYEFRCPDGHTFDRFYRKISDAVAELECPVCGKLATRQLSGGAGLVFKGSGFYLTDYGKNAHRESGTRKPDAGSDKAKTDSAASGESKPAESKPAEKAAEPASKNTKPAETKSASTGSSSTSGGKSDT